jgi:hypothetical protein
MLQAIDHATSLVACGAASAALGAAGWAVATAIGRRRCWELAGRGDALDVTREVRSERNRRSYLLAHIHPT